MSQLVDKLSGYLDAGFSGIWVRTHEPVAAERDICRECFGTDIELAAADGIPRFPLVLLWDCASGTRLLTGSSARVPAERSLLDLFPDEAERPQLLKDFKEWAEHPPGKLVKLPSFDDLGTLFNVLPTMNQVEQTSGQHVPVRMLVVLRNVSLFAGNAIIIQHLQNLVELGTRPEGQFTLLGLNHVKEIPQILRRHFQVVEHPLPDEEVLLSALRSVKPEVTIDYPEDEIKDLLASAYGLNSMEAENAFAYADIMKPDLDPKLIFDIKASILAEMGLGLNVWRGNESFEDIGGMSHLKDFTLSMFDHGEEGPVVRPRGIILNGVSGTGKSLFSKALGNMINRPTLGWNPGRVISKYQGESQENLDRILETIEALSPCVLWIDEIEKLLVGAASSGQTDSGTKASIFGRFITWLNDLTAPVYMVVTSNDIQKITADNPEFLRRFDAMFFADYPEGAQKEAIWDIHMKKYNLTEEMAGPRPETANWTGSDIDTCCRMAALRRIPLKQVPISPLHEQAKDQVEALRQWATNKCLSTEYADIYDAKQHHAMVSAPRDVAKTERRTRRKRSTTQKS